MKYAEKETNLSTRYITFLLQLTTNICRKLMSKGCIDNWTGLVKHAYLVLPLTTAHKLAKVAVLPIKMAILEGDILQCYQCPLDRFNQPW